MINSLLNSHTIAAISTPPGNGGIGIIRISGPDSFDIGINLFKLKSKNNYTKLNKDKLKYRYLYYGVIHDSENNINIDEVLIVFMKSPNSYTAEDVVEIQSHSGKFVLDKILSLVLNFKAVPAEPGEFTKRAFLNGRIDLTEAEAVMDIIKSSSEASHKIARSLSSGDLKNKILIIRDKFVEIEALITALVDFPDDIEDNFDKFVFFESLNEIKEVVSTLIFNYDNSHQVRDGYKIAIAGPPNAGKSSLLNRLISKERAIVTSIPGTTRDIIEESLNLDGFPFVVSDTAGIRETDNEIEKIGVSRSLDLLKNSDLIIFLVDGSKSFDFQNNDLFNKIKKFPYIFVVNKTDLFSSNVSRETFLFNDNNPVFISASKNTGIDELKKNIIEYFKKNFTSTESYIVPNKRQFHILKKIKINIDTILNLSDDSFEIELISYDLNNCIKLCSELIGETVSPDILDKVFGDFCIGK